MLTGAIVGAIASLIYFFLNLLFNKKELSDGTEQVNWVRVVLCIIAGVAGGILGSFLF